MPDQQRRADAGKGTEEKKPRKTPAKCDLYTIVQSECDIGTGPIRCFDLPRVFRLCPGRPTVEVTHVVDFVNDKPVLQPGFQDAVPPSAEWNAP